MPGLQSCLLGHRGEQPCALLALDLDRPQSAPIPGENLVEGPAAKAAVAVIEDRCLSIGIRSPDHTSTPLDRGVAAAAGALFVFTADSSSSA